VAKKQFFSGFIKNRSPGKILWLKRPIDGAKQVKILILKSNDNESMQKLGLSQSLQQKLSPQQIQFIKLLQVPTAELEARIEEELEINPALEEGTDEPKEESYEETQEEYQETSGSEDEIDIKDYLRDDDYAGYKSNSERRRPRITHCHGHVPA
jgi:hypothetical protein